MKIVYRNVYQRTPLLPSGRRLLVFYFFRCQPLGSAWRDDLPDCPRGRKAKNRDLLAESVFGL